VITDHTIYLTRCAIYWKMYRWLHQASIRWSLYALIRHFTAGHNITSAYPTLLNRGLAKQHWFSLIFQFSYSFLFLNAKKPSNISLYQITLPASYNIGFKSSATLKGASVLLRISSTVTPSAISVSVIPVAKSTSTTPCS